MKLEALDHPKTLNLAQQLGVGLPTAIGHLELLWAFTGKRTPCGDVGKWPDGVIASACHWQGNPADFIEALVSAGYVDRDSKCRLLIHDWPQHCPNWVRAKVKSAGLSFTLSATLKDGLNGGSSGGSNGQSSGATTLTNTFPSVPLPKSNGASQRDRRAFRDLTPEEQAKALERGFAKQRRIAAQIGFRGPLSGESLDCYRAKVAEAQEHGTGKPIAIVATLAAEKRA